MIAVALASVRGHFGRFLLTALAVALGVAFTTGTYALSDSLDETFTDLIGDSTAGTDAYVRGVTEASGFQVDPTQPTESINYVEKLKAVDGVANAVPEIGGFATLVGADGTAVRRGGAPTLAFPYFDDDPVVQVLKGRMPANDTEIAIEQTTLALSGLKVGDSASVLAGAERLEMTVVAEVDTGTVAGATVLLFDYDTALSLFAPDNRTSAFTVRGDGSVSQSELVQRLKPVLPKDFEVLTGEQFTEERTASVKESLNFITQFLLIFAVIALVVGGFLIVNTFLMVLGQRTQELAMLRAIGSRKRQVVGMVMAEALVIGVLGAFFGFLLGFGLTVGLASLLNTLFDMQLPTVPPITMPTIIAASVIGVGVTLVSAFIPAMKASRVPPVAAMRAETATARKPFTVRWALAAIALLAGVGLAFPALNLKENSAWFMAASAAALFVGTVALSAPVAGRFIMFLSWPVGNMSAVGTMAKENAARNPRRTALTAGALMIGLALVSGVGVLSASAEKSTSATIDQGLAADFVLNGGFQGLPSGLGAKVTDVAGVVNVAEISRVPAEVNGDEQSVIATTIPDLKNSIKFRVAQGSLDSFDDSTVAVSDEIATKNSWQLGDSITLSTGELREEPLKVVAILEKSVLVPDVLVNRPLIERSTKPERRFTESVYIKAADGADLAAVERGLTEVVEPLVVVSVETKAEFADSLFGSVQRLLNIVNALLGLSIAIAALGVANTLAMSIFERTREIGMLRAVGLKRGQLWLMVVLESVWTAVFGALLGVVLGIALGVLAQKWLVREGLTELAIPWSTLVMVFVGAAIIGVLAALAPARRATRIRMLDAISGP